jgi:hypothetical protein
MYRIFMVMLTTTIVSGAGLSSAAAEAGDIRTYAAKVPPHIVGCVPFDLVDEDDDAAVKAIESARQSWARGALDAGVDKVGFLFVLDQDQKRQKGAFPITLSLCGTVVAKADSKGVFKFVDIKQADGQIIFCAVPSVEKCMQKIKDKITASDDQLPKFPRYGLWTRADPPTTADEAVDGLIGPLVPVAARFSGDISAVQQPGEVEPPLRPLGSLSFRSCASEPQGCPKPDGPGDPVGVLIFLPSN